MTNKIKLKDIEKAIKKGNKKEMQKILFTTKIEDRKLLKKLCNKLEEVNESNEVLEC